MTSDEPTNGDRPHRRRRKRRKPDNAVDVRHARQIARIVTHSEDVQRARAVELRVRGKTYHEIAEEMELSVSAAAALVNGVLRQAVEIDADKLEEQRQLEIDRLERLWSVWFPRATRDGTDDEGQPLIPNMAAATLCLKIAKRRAELVGLDREQKVGATLNINVGAEQLRQVVEAAQDPEAALALERVAAMFAHGEEALEAEWDEVDELAPAEEPPDDD